MFGRRSARRPRRCGSIHDAVSRGAYESVRGGVWLATRAVGTAARRRVGDVPLSETPRGAMAIAALNGLYGDRLEAEGSPLAIPMQFRRHGAPAPHVAVFVHGLGETEYAWGSPSYGDRLRDDLGISPVYVRYNTGRHISQNGVSLAQLLEGLDAERITLVGHSMGGLIARAACHHGGDWTSKVRLTVSLGTPHAGAPLEQAVHAISAALHLAPETRPFARFLRRRSAGIRDLRRGSLVDEDWSGRDPDALRAKALREVPLLPNATHAFVAATITRSDKHPARPPARRHARALPQRVRPPPRPRARPGARRHAPPGAAQPPRGLRAAARLGRGVIARPRRRARTATRCGRAGPARQARGPARSCSGPSGMWWCSRRSPLIRCTRVARSTRSDS